MKQILTISRKNLTTKDSIKSATKVEKGIAPSRRDTEALSKLLKKMKIK